MNYKYERSAMSTMLNREKQPEYSTNNGRSGRQEKVLPILWEKIGIGLYIVRGGGQ
jgi:hypothetical protein